MEFIRSAAWLTAYWALGEGLTAWLRLPVPGSVIGLLLLYVSLRLSLVRPEWIAPGARGLLGVLGLLFVPTGAGVIAYSGVPWAVLVPAIALLAALVIGLGGLLLKRSLKV